MTAEVTDITVVLDRSGSMDQCKSEVIGGLKKFVEEQQKQPWKANYTLVQFDDEYEVVHSGIPIDKVPELNFKPRGCTALNDAVGKAIVSTGERLAAMSESDRPGLVMFVIVTDGHENSSKEFKRRQIKEMIEHQTNVYQWKFTYLGANQDAFKVGNSLGVNTVACANFTSDNADKAFVSASAYVSRSSGARHGGLSGLWSGEDVGYTESERKSMTEVKS